MTRKSYKTKTLRGYSMTLTIEGEPVFISFSKGAQADGGAVYSTTDPRVQEAMERLVAFGRDFYLDSTIDYDEPAAPVASVASVTKPLPEVFKDIRRFRNLPEMKNAMREVGIDIKDNAPYDVCKAAAYKEGYDFQIQK